MEKIKRPFDAEENDKEFYSNVITNLNLYFVVSDSTPDKLGVDQTGIIPGGIFDMEKSYTPNSLKSNYVKLPDDKIKISLVQAIN